MLVFGGLMVLIFGLCIELESIKKDIQGVE